MSRSRRVPMGTGGQGADLMGLCLGTPAMVNRGLPGPGLRQPGRGALPPGPPRDICKVKGPGGGILAGLGAAGCGGGSLPGGGAWGSAVGLDRARREPGLRRGGRGALAPGPPRDICEVKGAGGGSLASVAAVYCGVNSERGGCAAGSWGTTWRTWQVADRRGSGRRDGCGSGSAARSGVRHAPGGMRRRCRRGSPWCGAGRSIGASPRLWIAGGAGDGR